MNKLYVAGEFTDVNGQVRIMCDDLVGTSRNWLEPARILGLQPADFILLLRTEYNANITPYRKNGKLSFIGYSWSTLAEARKFKNFLNAKARAKRHMI